MSQVSRGRPRRSSVLWLRWSWRDLRARWLQVLAIAMVIALGTGSYAGISSVSQWRRISTDNAYEQLNMFDLRIRLLAAEGAPAGDLIARVNNSAVADSVAAMEERLVTDIQVDASTDEQTILVPGLLYGVDLSEGGPDINGLIAAAGRTLSEDDVGDKAAVLEGGFARHYSLPAEGEIKVSGGETLSYIGQVITPEYFVVTTEQGGLLAEANFAAVFTSLETAQQVSGRAGEVNELLLTLRPGSNPESLRQTLTEAFAGDQISVSITTKAEDPAFRLTDRDIRGDRRLFRIFAFLILTGAVGAAFNLSSRIVEAQRRDIGVAMALGLPPWKIAIRPMLVGAQVALLGVVIGMVLAYAIGQLMIGVWKDLNLLPAWQTPFQFGLFATAAAIGFVLPLLATAWPVWRAVRVPPIETIRPAYRSGRGGGLAPVISRVRLPGNTIDRFPVRNLVRSPRRTLLTVLGIAAALATLVTFVGLLDSIAGMAERSDRELLRESPDRVDIRLSGFSLEQSSEVQAIVKSPLVSAAEPGLFLDSQLVKNDEDIGIQLELLNLEGSIWRPSLISGAYDRTTVGIYLSELAAKDLGLRTGSMVVLRHPYLQQSGTVTLVETELPVLGVHPNPFRFAAYMDINQAGVFGMEGLTNRMKVSPAVGVSDGDLKRELMSFAGVTSLENAGDVAQAIRDAIDEFVLVLRIIQVVMLLIAGLIAFNSASINLDERRREHATMFAFGLPVGTVLRLEVIEHLILGAVATAIGLAGGWFLLRLIVETQVADLLPDLYIKPAMGASTILIALALGIVSVALAPLLTWRKLSRMDVPGTLKVME